MGGSCLYGIICQDLVPGNCPAAQAFHICVPFTHIVGWAALVAAGLQRKTFTPMGPTHPVNQGRQNIFNLQGEVRFRRCMQQT